MNLKIKILIVFSILFFICFFYIKPITVSAIPSDQNTVLLKSWALPIQSNQNNSFAITSSFSGSELYFIESNSNKIGRLMPSTNAITEWNIPTTNSLPSSIKFDPSAGNAYFIESSSNRIGQLNPTTNAITEWNIPTNNSSPSILAVDSSTGNVYFIESNSNKIGRLVPSTNMITEWNLSSNYFNSTKYNEPMVLSKSISPKILEVDSSTGNVYFIESNSNKIGRLVPSTNMITEWLTRTNTINTKYLTLGFNAELYFIESNSNKIGRLVPSTNMITEWNIPTTNSLPSSIKFDPSTGNVYFIESNSNKIGRLVPSTNAITEWNLQEKPIIMDVDSAGNVHFIDKKGTRIFRLG